ncbi:MAG: Holliday junction branch migration protein RuvA [Betaproteobacteria bacterium]|nr:Holliday junction branch migration protein RuvA [Betaproteobacteria bacterium]
MIGRITGILLEKNPPQVVVDANGVGYEIDVPMSTFYGLPKVGDKLALYTHLVVREDAQLLYGFATESERSTFRTLIKVSGVGPKVALAVLSGMSVGDLAEAIALQESGRLTRVPGIGKKTAERLLLELKDKFKMDAPIGATGATAAPTSATADVLNALIGLGYSEKEALPAVKKLPPEVSVSEGIRQALKLLSKS